MIFVGIISTLLILSVKCEPKFEDPDIIKNFSKDEYQEEKMLTTMTLYTVPADGCTPIRAWVLTRHGTKNPSTQIMNNISHKLKGIQNSLKEIRREQNNIIQSNTNYLYLINSLIEWESYFSDVKVNKGLNNHGEKMMTDFGERLHTKLKTLVQTLMPNEIEVLSGLEDRCRISCDLILKSLFKNNSESIVIKSDINDRRLKLKKVKDSRIMVHDNDGKLINPEEYYFNKHVSEVKNRIQNLLFPDYIQNYNTYRELITVDIVKTMHYACAYGFSQPNNIDRPVWCQVFSFEDLKMFENMYDIDYYYKFGYHLEANRKVGNEIAEDIIQFITKPEGKKFKLFVGHTSNCLSVVARFNLFNDNKKLDVDNIDELYTRQWKTSFISPVGCNIMVVVYECSQSADSVVSIYVNEVRVKIVLNETESCVRCPPEKIVDLLQSLEVQDS